MNELFVNIKVDREERPDLDQLYMDTVTRPDRPRRLAAHRLLHARRPAVLRRHLLPARAARHGLPAFRDVLRGHRERLPLAARRGRAERRAHPRGARPARPRARAGAAPGAQCAARAAHALLRRADPEHGGFGGAPKFPTPPSLELLLAAADVAARAQGARGASTTSSLTCRAMARGGIYDQLGGGFHRYSVDAAWACPTSRRCSTTRASCCASTREAWRRSRRKRSRAALAGARDRRVSAPRDDRRPTAASTPARTPTARARRAPSTSGRREQVEARLGAERAAAFCAGLRRDERGNFERRHQRAARPRRAKPRDAASPPSARRCFAARAPAHRPGHRPQARRGLERPRDLGARARRRACSATTGMLADARGGRGLRARAACATATAACCACGTTGAPHVPAFLDDHAALLEARLDLHRAGAGERFLGRALRRWPTEIADALLRRGRRRPLPHALGRRAARACARARTTTARRRTPPGWPSSGCCASPTSRATTTCRGSPSA